MKITGFDIPGPLLLVGEPISDVRGSFVRTFCRAELAQAGASFELSQTNLSHNRARGTLRGMHFQRAPHEEPKIVSCVRGAIFDVAVDVRVDSPTRWRWVGVELLPDTATSLFIPAGFAHGFQTLEHDTLVSYLMGAPFHASSGAGLRWNDPKLGIAWPDPDAPIVSERDRSFPLL